MKRIGIVFGTRPEAVKLAPILRALESDPRFDPVAISTGQHREMLAQTLSEFSIEPHHDLEVMVPGQSLSMTTARILAGLDDGGLLRGLDAVAVHGDTASTLAGALAGLHAQVPVVHIEAGLRSGALSSPFPEEANRKLVGQIAALHLAPTPGNAANLIREGINENAIAVTGNSIVDAVRWGVEQDVAWPDELADIADEQRSTIVASAHRRETWGAPLVEIAEALRQLALTRDDVRIVVPVHLNPKVRQVMIPALSRIDNVTLVDPLPYLQFCKLLSTSTLILSDSSGAEEEGPALGKPTLVLRERSERRESLMTGAAKLVSRSCDRIVANVVELLDDPVIYRSMATAINPYGDGLASERTVQAIAHFFELGPAIAPFVPGYRLPVAV